MEVSEINNSSSLYKWSQGHSWYSSLPISSNSSKYPSPDKMGQMLPEYAEVALQERIFEIMKLGANTQMLTYLLVHPSGGGEERARGREIRDLDFAV